MSTNVQLTAQLERFARECVKSGRYSDLGEVIRSGLRLLQEAEERRVQFMAMLRDAERESDREGSVELESVLAEVDRIIDEARR
jgi:antitoxin ParD1/3/4